MVLCPVGVNVVHKLEIKMADISLTASMRTNLLSLQNTQSLMDMTQERLSTGNKVNSAIDNPSSYYTARSLNNRASDLNALLDSMGQGIQTIKAANEGIEAITSFVEQAKALINTAKDTAASKVAEVESKGTYAKDADSKDVTFKLTVGDKTAEITVASVETDEATGKPAGTALAAALQIALNGATDADGESIVEGEFAVTVKDGQLVISNNDKTVAWSIESKTADDTINGLTIKGEAPAAAPNTRTSSQAQYKEILNQINGVAKDAGYKGINLLQSDTLVVNFNESRGSFLEVNGVSADVEGLKLDNSDADWDNVDNKALDAAMEAVDKAISTLRTWSSELGNNYAILQSREDFTEKLVNVLTEGADKLTLADMNEESANMLALQTRQQLAINSLSLASQAAQSVLKLF
ncbi:MAG: hypothetical protein E7019_03145 [Alphaproteobacteria bacterium]|nr:hypothetical protein [Alphaproteobacteria bacterium]